ncbi:DNA helicase PIF1, ATP-dependent [Elysia marginata]|uniref:DNA helicase PIF1, ATP-dependent n=1 Tax=Elysia marginata TaxID=1093978 RepID=A0AAV4G954_9GAST|nr:DNA helicase PIF1, ATP-dependent [Elysia marginata]
MFEKQQDAMAYLRKYGCPDMFITVTTNPNWKEITDHLLEGQHPHDRLDLLVRVFRLKLKQTMHALKNGCLGSVDAWLYNIEFQKRGLPHAHILLWISCDSKIHPCMIDAAVPKSQTKTKTQNSSQLLLHTWCTDPWCTESKRPMHERWYMLKAVSKTLCKRHGDGNRQLS